MELIIVVAAIGLSVGCIFGMFLIGRHIELEVERAYLSGHVDGYGKAMFDSGEVPL